MELQGESIINASRQEIWAALIDPAVLAKCIDGVESLDALGDNRFAGVLNAKVGPVKARFTGTVALTEMDPPNRYVLVGEGKGGVAGFAKGSAEVVLTDLPDGATLLRYVARSQVGGKLAQLGTRLIEGTAKAYAENFFAAFKAQVEGPVTDVQKSAETAAIAGEPMETAGEPMPGSDQETAIGRSLPGWAWIGGLILVVALILLFLY